MTHLEKAYLDAAPVYGFFLFLLGAVSLFILRAPVIVVTDDIFSAVYGTRREHLKRIEMSVRLFRRVKLVRVSENAEIDAIVFAVQDASGNPLTSVFPYRYYEAARMYSGQNPRTPVTVMAGQNRTSENTSSSEGGTLVFVKEDELSDFYRAGLCAALFSARKASVISLSRQEDNDKSVLMISNEPDAAQAKDFFERGLRDGGSEASPVFRTVSENYPVNDLSCIALWGAAGTFLYSSTENEVPMIIFSWIDPEFSSPNVKIMVDDSPLQLLPAIIKSFSAGSIKRRLRPGNELEIQVPSAFKISTLRTKSLLLAVRLNIAAALPVKESSGETGG